MTSARALPPRLVLLGHPVAHSLSPRFQNAALEAAGLALRYEALDTSPAELASTVAQLRVEGAAGNVTIPHKERMALLCDHLTAVAARAGAVNTFWCDERGLWGDNTDVGGFDRAARALFGGAPPAGTHVALLGAGGAAAAVLVALSSWPAARVWLFNRGRQRAEALAERFGPMVTTVESAADAARSGTDLVVNATSIGLRDDAVPIPVEALAEHCAVLDLVYRRGETPWTRAAREAGHRAADGLEMLLEQGALAFERWIGAPPDRAAMRQALVDDR